MSHPLAIQGNTSGFQDKFGSDVRAGDRVLHLRDGRTGVLDEALHDGDAFVTFDNGQYATVKWACLRKIP